MPKKSCSRKKGIQKGIPRHSIKRKKQVDEQQNKNNETKGSLLFCFSQSKLSSFGAKCFDFLFVCCEKFHLIGFTQTNNGEFIPLSRNGYIWHYAVLSFCLVLWMQKSWVTAQVFFYEELRMESFMCLSVAVVYNCTAVLASGVVLRPKETMDLYNSWAQISASLKTIDPSSRFHPLENFSACLKVTSTVLVTQGVAVAIALLSLIMSDLPIFLFPMAEKTGVLPKGILPKWGWQIIFATLEWQIVLPFVLIASFSANLFYMENALLDTYLRQLGNIKIRGMESRRRLEQMYVQLEHFNRIAQVWIRFFFPPWLFALSLGVIVSIFVTIRYTELPLIFYVFFPYTGMNLMILIFWQSYDMFRTVRASEDILGRLWKHDAPYFRGMTRAERIEKMKRSKALKPLTFSIADSEFSLNLPINTWDEILNQILFLLSL